MADPQIMTENERIKSISRTLLQVGSALFAAALVKAYGANGLALETAAWLLTAAALMFLGWKILILLDSEN